MRKRNIYEDIFNEIVRICDLFPGWNVSRFIEEERLVITNVSLLHSELKEYREKLELDNHVITDEDETDLILEEGLRIHSSIIKQQMYGEEN